ncbi:MAG: imidazole glycerol phosphate synthase subunit HisH [Rhodospirillales bacterium]|nr:imidazole glycerol phosphate synthase subunit HisH [Rhodospirillales bacterium]
MIAIIDYTVGNLRSVANAFEHLGVQAFIANRPDELREASAIVLPGVGAFASGMSHLKRLGFDEALEREVRDGGKPFLGICLGMQLLATRGMEHGAHAGLNWVSGTVELLRVPENSPQLRIPHIGWNDVQMVSEGGLFRGFTASEDFYFVHSYVLKPNDPAVVAGTCLHSEPFAAAIETANICAVQFHPEKSHRAGLQLLRNWAEMTGQC